MCTDSNSPAPPAVDCGDSATSEIIHAVDALVGTWARPRWDEYFMAATVLISSRSSCGRLHVGCLIVSSGRHPNRIIAAGYNGFLPGAPHQSHMRDGHEQATVHAEQNAIADAAKRGVALEGATAYVTHYPCAGCAKILAAAGINAIKYLHDYKNDPLVAELLAQAHVSITKIGEKPNPKPSTQT